MLVVSRNTLPAKNLKELVAWIKANPERHHRHRGRWLRLARCRRLFRKSDRHASAIRALSRHRSSAARPDGRAHRHDVRPGVGGDAARARQSDPGLCGHRQDALGVDAGYPDRGRGRIAGPLHQYLVRPVGAEGHAARHHRQAQSRRRGRHGRSDGAKALCRFGPRRAIARSADAAALGALQRAEIEKWWPIIKAAGIKAE